MTIYFINNRPHVAADNHFKEISYYDYYMMLEHNEVKNIEDIHLYD
jgi:hypothetical protein